MLVSSCGLRRADQSISPRPFACPSPVGRYRQGSSDRLRPGENLRMPSSVMLVMPHVTYKLSMSEGLLDPLSRMLARGRLIACLYKQDGRSNTKPNDIHPGGDTFQLRLTRAGPRRAVNRPSDRQCRPPSPIAHNKAGPSARSIISRHLPLHSIHPLQLAISSAHIDIVALQFAYHTKTTTRHLQR